MIISSTADQIVKNLNTLGNKTAIVIDGKDYSYAYIKERVSSLATSIQKNTDLEERIGLQLQNNIECYIGLISLLISGRVFVPLNEGFGLEQNSYMIETSGISKVIVSTESKLFKALIKSQDLQLLESDNSQKEKTKYIPTNNAYLLFTSGSTGNPKGVPISHSNLDNFIQGMVQDKDWDLDSEDRFLQPFNLSFDLFVFTVYLPLYLGATFLTVPLNKISIYSAALLKEENITVSLLVPSTMKIINKLSSSYIFDSLKYSFFCGEALYATDLKNWIKSTPNAKQINIYGPTEATVAFTKYIWTNDLSEEESKNDIVPIGIPFGNNLLGLYEMENGEKELLLGGPQVFEAYVGTNKDPFVDQDGIHYYRTGDTCEINENGNYLFLGRNDGQVKVDGYRIEISDVENKLKKIFPGRQLVVIHTTNEENLSAIHAFITGEPISEIDQLIEQYVPDYMRPSSFKFLKNIPLNMNGKTDRKKLKSML